MKENIKLNSIGTLKLTEKSTNTVILKKNLILKYSPHILALGLSGNIISSNIKLASWGDNYEESPSGSYYSMTEMECLDKDHKDTGNSSIVTLNVDTKNLTSLTSISFDFNVNKDNTYDLIGKNIQEFGLYFNDKLFSRIALDSDFIFEDWMEIDGEWEIITYNNMGEPFVCPEGEEVGDDSSSSSQSDPSSDSSDSSQSDPSSDSSDSSQSDPSSDSSDSSDSSTEDDPINESLKILASDGSSGDIFGNSVSIDGNYAVVGANRDESYIGSAYVFNVTTGSQLFKLTSSDGAGGDQLGISVSVSGNYAILGAHYDDDNGSNSGSAYIFNVTTGAQLFKLTPSDGASSDYFGDSVGIDGNYAVVGTKSDDDNGSESGSAYVFNVTTGAQLFKLTPSDGASYSWFGKSVSVSGNYAVIGAGYGSSIGSAYVFNVTTGAQLFKLTPSDGASSDGFGISVSVSGNYAVIGSPGDDDNGSNSGSAYVFNVTTGAQLFKLTPSDGESGDWFGNSVSVDGNYAVVGVYNSDDNGSNSGSAYVFNITTGAQLFKLTASDGAGGDLFGNSVDIDGNYAVIGSPSDDDNGSNSGSAYIFDIS